MEATPEDLEKARVLLELFVRGVAASLKLYGGSVFSQEEVNKNASVRRWSVLVERIIDGSTENIGIPIQKDTPETFHIAKARLSTLNSLPEQGDAKKLLVLEL